MKPQIKRGSGFSAILVITFFGSVLPDLSSFYTPLEDRPLLFAEST